MKERNLELIPANHVKPGDYLMRFGQKKRIKKITFHIHPALNTQVIDFEYSDKGTHICFVPTSLVEVWR